jgi:hypothetical protein
MTIKDRCINVGIKGRLAEAHRSSIVYTNPIMNTRDRADTNGREICVLLAKLEWIFSLESSRLYVSYKEQHYERVSFFLNMSNIYRVNTLSDECGEGVYTISPNICINN